MSGPLDLDAIAATDALLRELHAPTKAIAQSPESTRPNWPERKCFYCEADWPCEPIRAAVHLTALVGRVRELESEIEHERRVHDDDLNAFIREEAKRDPAFATAYLNAEARTERDAATAEVLRLERVLAGTVLLKDDFAGQLQTAREFYRQADAERDEARAENARLRDTLALFTGGPIHERYGEAKRCAECGQSWPCDVTMARVALGSSLPGGKE